MAREEGGKAKPWGKKGFLSAVYVNRFGRHLSGTAIRFGHNEAKEQKLQDRGVVCSPAGSTCPLNDPASLDVGLKSRRYKKKATFTPPKHTKQAESPLEQTHAGALTQNNGGCFSGYADTDNIVEQIVLQTIIGQNHDVFKFPLPANSNAAKSKDKKKKGLFCKNREAFRVIYKMLQENENLRSRLLANSQKSTLVPGEQTTLEREKGSPKNFEPSPFGWV